MRYNHLDMLPEKAFKPVGKRMTLEGGGGGNTTGTTYSTTLPEYAKPYYEELLKQTGKNIFTTDADGNVTGVKGPENLPKQTAAERNAIQTAAQTGIAGLQTPGDFANASAGLNYGTTQAFNAANQGLNQALSYDPQAATSQSVSGPSVQHFQMGKQKDVVAPSVQQYTMQAAQSGYNPTLQNYQMQNAPNVSGQAVNTNAIQAAQTNFRPELQQYQMQGPQSITAQSMTGADAAAYMSPYQQAVTDTALREARLQGGLQKQQGALGAIGRGTFGGARQALLQAEQQRGVNQQLSDIQYKGQQDAYAQAQAQFNADQARKMQAATANQQASLSTGQQNLQANLATQQLGTQAGLQATLANLTNQQQANVQTEANRLQASGMSADNAMKAALANQQASLTTGQQNLQSNLATQQLGTQTGTQMALANLTNAQQANVQNLASQLQTQGLSADAALKAALANQQTGLQTGIQNLQSNLATQQLASQNSLAAQTANQAANLEAQKLTQQGEQYAAGLGKDVGLAGLQAGMTGSGQLGALANTQQIADLERLKAQAATGADQQAYDQKIADLKYQNEMAAQNYEKQQIQYYSDILRGNAGALGSTAVQYGPAPSALSQVGGLGLGALGLAKAYGP
jgi:hypothetical protein